MVGRPRCRTADGLFDVRRRSMPTSRDVTPDPAPTISLPFQASFVTAAIGFASESGCVHGTAGAAGTTRSLNPSSCGRNRGPLVAGAYLG
jgi:hypothetical protein